MSPDETDYKDYPEVKVVYIVRSSVLYDKPVRLLDFAITGIKFGKIITEARFDQIKKGAGDVQEYRPRRLAAPQKRKGGTSPDQAL